MLTELISLVPTTREITGRLVVPFVGGGSVFFAMNPRHALLSDINAELMEFYRGVRADPARVWQEFRAFPSGKRAYYRIRDYAVQDRDRVGQAARILYLNRTCFKGMWRHNSQGRFNIGYGGQDRRWVISEDVLIEVAKRLKRAALKISDFEHTIDSCRAGDFLFLDPPYSPGEREIANDHYVFSKFLFGDHERLARALRKASRRMVKWALTTSSHPDILGLFPRHNIVFLRKGTGKRPGVLSKHPGEVLIRNCGG